MHNKCDKIYITVDSSTTRADKIIKNKENILIYKVLFQPDKSQTPRRETTQTIYLEANSKIEALKNVEDNTNYNIELVQELDGDFLDYEKKNPDFKITEF